MITLKSKIVKSEFINKAFSHAINKYNGSYMPIYQNQAFMEGVKYTLNELQLKK